MLMRSYVHRGIFKTKLNICDGAFFTLVKPYFKNILNQITFRFHFLHNSPFRKKTYDHEKSCSQWNNFFFEIRNYSMEWHHHKKMNEEGFLN